MANTQDGVKRHSTRRATLISVLMTLAVMAVTFLVCFDVLSPERYALNAGDIAPENIFAASDVTDDAATVALRETAMSAVSPVYIIDTIAAETLRQGAEDFFSQLLLMRSEAAGIAGAADSSELSLDEWQSKLITEQVSTLCAECTPALSEQELYAVLAAQTTDVMMLRNLVVPQLSTSLDGGLTEQGVSDVKAAFYRQMSDADGISDALRALGIRVFDRFIGVTYVEDSAATTVARESAAAAVQDAVIRRGELIVAEGSTVTAAQIAVLSELGMLDDGGGLRLAMGLLVYVALLYFLFIVYMLLFKPTVMINVKKMLITSVMMFISVLLCWLCAVLGARMTPVIIAAMLIALLACEDTAMAASVTLSLSVGIICGMRGGTIDFYAFAAGVSTLCACVTAVFALRKTVKRGSIIASGAIGGGAAALCVLGIYLVYGESFANTLEAMGWALGCGVLCAILVVGSLSIWERLFDVATTARLNELLNANQPLLKQLTLEAPGTYQHSVAVGALAEGAAHRINANALLAKAGAYYHDVGKLRRPLYFKENQHNVNIHDSLPPAESAATIIAHQKDSVTILTKHHMPAEVIRIAGEHHGNSLLVYFYHKACQQGGEVDEKLYHYSGNRPSTRESAIVMLADSCEAAVRSLGECRREDMEEMVHKVIAGKGMLTRAPLTFAHLNDIERSFIQTFGGLMHERIEYPKEDE